MQRRDFLKLAGLTALFPYAAHAAGALARGYQRVLVLIDLKGGNDGLNTVVPYADPAYYAVRPRLGIARDQVVQLDERLGLHPALAPLMPLWNAGEMGAVLGVGYPRPNLSHFRSIEIWETASASDQYLSEGWLARVFRAHPTPARFAADGVVVGGGDLGPLAGTRVRAVVLNPGARAANMPMPEQGDPRAPSEALAHVLKVEHDTEHAEKRLRFDENFRTEFPKGPLAAALRTAAALIAADAGVAVIKVSQVGYDTHSNQAPVQARLLKELAEALVAFRGALVETGRWSSTLVVTYSEFGRRPRQNASGGTDHGTASPHFVFGGRVRGGLHGAMPSLTALENDNLVHRVDFRSVYSAVLRQWWDLDPARALGARVPPINIVRV